MKLLVLSSIILFIDMCCYVADISYIVHNDTAFPIKVVSSAIGTETVTDTFRIAPHGQATIAILEYGTMNVDTYKEGSERLNDFTSLQIFRDDTTESVTDFMIAERWKFDERTKHRADYILSVLPNDF